MSANGPQPGCDRTELTGRRPREGLVEQGMGLRGYCRTGSIASAKPEAVRPLSSGDRSVLPGGHERRVAEGLKVVLVERGDPVGSTQQVACVSPVPGAGGAVRLGKRGAGIIRLRRRATPSHDRGLQAWVLAEDGGLEGGQGW